MRHNRWSRRWAAMAAGLGVAFFAVLLGAPIVAQEGEIRFGVEGAPKTLMGDASFVLVTGTPEDVHQVCGGEVPVGDRVVLACTSHDRRIVVMPNPCLYNDVDPYARLLCHEKGHVNGWTHGS